MLKTLLVVACFSTTMFAQDIQSGHNTNPNRLKGDFPFNETIHIVQQPAVNGTCGSSLSGPVTSSIITDTGIWSFDGKGHVKMHDSGIFILVNPPTDASQVQPEAAQCAGTTNCWMTQRWIFTTTAQQTTGRAILWCTPRGRSRRTTYWSRLGTIPTVHCQCNRTSTATPLWAAATLERTQPSAETTIKISSLSALLIREITANGWGALPRRHGI